MIRFFAQVSAVLGLLSPCFAASLFYVDSAVGLDSNNGRSATAAFLAAGKGGVDPGIVLNAQQTAAGANFAGSL